MLCARAEAAEPQGRWADASRAIMDYVFDLLRSFVMGIAAALVATLLTIRRRRNEQRLRIRGFVETEQDRIAAYRARGGRITDNRSLRDEERHLLRYLLCEAELRPSFYCGQIETASVTGRCGCGCPSIDIATEHPQVHVNFLLPICEYTWRDESGRRFGILAIARGQQLAGLQLYAFDGGSVPKSLPAKAELQRA